MTELEKRLKHIEKTDAKEAEKYRKLQQQADKNFYKIQQREQKKEQAKTQLYNTLNARRDKFMTNKIISDSKNGTSNGLGSQDTQNLIAHANLLKYVKDTNTEKSKAIEEARDYLLQFNQKYNGKSKDDNARIAHEIGDINYFKALKTGDNYKSWTEDTNKTIEDYYNEYKANSDLKSPKSSMSQVNEQIKNSNGLEDAFSKKRNSSELKLRIENGLNRFNQILTTSILPRDEVFNYWQKKIDDGKQAIAENRKIEADTVNSRLQTGYEKMYEEIPYNQKTLNAIEKGISETKDEDIKRLTEDDEKLRYYYLRGTYGKDIADDYILSAVNDATIEEGKKRAENDSKLGEFGNAFSTGLADWSRGIYKAADSLTNQAVGDGFLDDYAYLNSTDQVQQQYNKEAAGKVKKFALDATETVGNQAPSIIIASATGSPTLGASTLAVSAMGNSYGQALLEGKSEDEAFTYGTIQGASEFVTEKLLGGQYGINGVTEKMAHKALNNVTNKLIKDKTMNAVANKVGKIVINGVGEFNEEALQQFMEPYFRNFSFGENNKQTRENLEDCLYSGLLGFFSSGITNTVGEVTTGAVNAVANKISDKKLSKAKDIYNAYQEQLLAKKQNENQTDNATPPTVETVFSETETNQKKAKRLIKTINKIDRGETVADSEIVELKYNETAAEMLGQMAGLRKNKITSDYDNQAVRAVINQAQNGKKNIDTATILNNIRSNMQSNQNLVENSNENGSDEVLNADEGNLTNTNQTALENATEPNMTSQLDEVSEAMPENITSNEETDVPNSNTYIDNVSDNFKYNKVVNNSNKIMKLGISTEKTDSTTIRKVKSVDNGVAQLLMTNGEVVPADTIDFSDNKNAEIILSNAGKYNCNTASTFIANYDSNTSTAENYSIAFNSVYRMAVKGLSINEIASQTRGARAILGENTFNAAINAGRNTANGTFADDTTNVTSSLQNRNKNNNVKGEASRINVRQAAKSLSTALGVKINVYNSDTSVRGYEQNGEVFINESYVNDKANSASEFNFILAHELTHTLEQSNYYDQLKTFILNSRVYDDYLTSNDTTHKAEISKRQELYERNGKELTKEEAERELIADFIADELLTNEECIRELAYKDKKMFAKVVEFIHKMIDNLKRFVRNSKDITAAQKDLIHIKELYTKAFNDVKKNGTYSNEVKYSKKLGGYNPDIIVSTKDINVFNISNINNISEVKEKVYNYLSNKYISTIEQSKPITNIDTGMKIEIWRKGINETFGNAKSYKDLSPEMKKTKLATMTNLAKMIKYGEVRSAEAKNYHNSNSSITFAYLTSPITIDGKNYVVDMDIRKSERGNRFYIHKIKMTDEVAKLGLKNRNKLNTSSANNNISHNDDIVNSNIRKNSENDTRKFSIDPEFESKYDNWDKKKSTFSFKIGTTSEALKSIGVKDLSVFWDASKIIKIQRDHPQMTDDVIKQVPNVLENPILIMKSITVDGRLTLFGEVYDAANNPVLAVLELNPTNAKDKSLNIIKIASAYGKDTNPQRLIDNSQIVYIEPNKKRTNDWLKLNRLQLPLVNQSGSNNSISQKNNTVNSNIRKNSENDTKYSIDPDVESQMKALNEQYGTKKKGENPVRDIDVPERSSKDKRVREFVKTILESGALTDEMVNEVDKQIVKGAASYMPLSNENTLRVAKEWLDNKGKGVTEKQWNDWRVMSNRNHKVSALDVAKGELLLRYAAQNNDTKKVIQLTGELAEMATTAGQTVQAMRLLKKSSGIGKLYYIQQTVRRMNADYQAKYANKLAKGKDIPQITIDEDLALKLAQAKTQTEIEEAEAAITKNIGEQVPATWIDKWNAWRYMSMLFNPTTHIRNIVGNAIFMPAVSMKNGIAYGLEKAFLKGDIEKSKALKVKDAYKEFAKQDFDYVKAELTGNGKYESTDMIKSNRVIFKNKILEGLRSFNTNLLEAEDGIFLKHHYERALGMYLQANNISLNELSDEKAEIERQAAIDKGRALAIKEAQKATYRDDSAIANALSRLAKENILTEITIEGVIPFKKTPVNIGKRAFEYSPLGLIKNVTKDIYDLKTGKITASEYIDRISAGLTGAGIYALGLWLGSLGLLKVGLGDDEKEQDFEKLKGHQDYSIEIELFGLSYTFDWACPAAIPLFIGAKTHEILENDKSGLTPADYTDLAVSAFDPMFEMSVLSGINSIFRSIRYNKDDKKAGMDIALYAASSYLGQAVPTLGGKIASTIDGTKRSSYIDKSNDTFVSKYLISTQQQFINNIIKKIPGATYLLDPDVNEWGEQEKENNIGMRIFKNFISPGYVSKIEVDEAEKMLDKLYEETKEDKILPTTAIKYFASNGEKIHLTSEEYTALATTRGQIAHTILHDFSKKSEFEDASNEDKEKFITDAYDFATQIAKTGVDRANYEPYKKVKYAIEANKNGMSYADFLIKHKDLNDLSGEGTKQRIYYRIKHMNINRKAKEALWKSFYDEMKLEGERIYF